MHGAQADFVTDSIQNPDAFVVKLEVGHLLALPSGYMMAIASIGSVTGVRWSMSSDEGDSMRVKDMLSRMMNDFPETRSKGYQQFYDFLESS